MIYYKLETFIAFLNNNYTRFVNNFVNLTTVSTVSFLKYGMEPVIVQMLGGRSKKKK